MGKRSHESTKEQKASDEWSGPYGERWGMNNLLKNHLRNLSAPRVEPGKALEARTLSSGCHDA